MDLTPYIDGLQRDLVASVAAGGAEVTRTAELLSGSLEASARLCLLEALSDATAEITARLRTATVDVRLRGREADLTVTEIDDVEPDTGPTLADTVARLNDTIGATGDLARVTLRIPEPLKEQVERAAATEGISVNAWLVRAIGAAVGGLGGTPPLPPMPPGRPRRGPGRRLTGFAQT